MEEPRRDRKPDKKERPDTASGKVVVAKHLSKRTPLEKKAHEELERDCQAHPDNSDRYGLAAGRWRPRIDNEPDEDPHRYRADEGRELVSAKLWHDLPERKLAKSAIADRDNQHHEPDQDISEQG